MNTKIKRVKVAGKNNFRAFNKFGFCVGRRKNKKGARALITPSQFAVVRDGRLAQNPAA